MSTLKTSMAARHARRRHGQRQALRPAGQHERQEPRLLPEEGLGHGRLQGARRPRRPRARSPTRSRPTATPRGAWASSPTPRTGWPATDWFEDLIMRYERPRRLQRLGHAQDQVRLPAWSSRPRPSSRSCCSPTATSLGGRKAIASTNFGTAGNPMFATPSPAAGCTSRATSSPASSRRTSRPTSTANVGVFGFPPASRRRQPDPRWWRPGHAAERHQVDQDGHEDALADEHRQRGRARTAARSSRRTRTSTSANYPNDLTKQSRPGGLQVDDQFLFDGSDPMPGEVGAGTFWKDMTAWISGQRGPRRRH